ncbi:MAG: VWA domain-containing protein [Gemmatimonadota bacterium]|nr:VWA domain-containing protein [Gemmatimonadota bacterium]MDH3367691.1 VWA domain-containing protein [Gemmatimonadota bacterium]MDH3477200.1 VWA domain-containing protein [Gemmatimonadota bacterium]MDH3569572.1 VWA domain-containing protein [Gemmatimonadota bacterium]MDH5550182.1 VWA domain-containing protein [Gemmatimonadota bacterium]
MFARPLLLLLLAAIPVWWWLRSRRRQPSVPYSDVTQVTQIGSRRRWLAELPVGLRSLALGAWIIAAAGPRAGDAADETTSAGIDIVMAVDISSSMLAEDFLPSNRLDVAKEQSVAFIDGRTFDQIGLVVFAGEALTRVPITVDYDVLRAAVRSVGVGELEDGTAIGTAIATAANRLRRSPGASKVMVLLTDGENTRGVLDPRTAAEAAAAFGIRIYTIGVGTEGEARMPIGRGVQGQLRYQTLPVRLDEPLLRDIAQLTGGRYFRATDPEALSRIFGQIDRLEKTPVVVTRYAHFEEGFRLPLLVGLGALTLELLVAATVVVRVP